MHLNQKGALPLLLIIAATGIIGVLIIASLAPFRGQIFSSLFPKNSSFAANATTTATFGNMNLSTTFNSIGIELFYSGHASASAQLEFKKSSESSFRKGLDLWATKSSITPSPAFYGSALQLEPNTPYEIKVILSDPGANPVQQTLIGSITTRADTIPAASSLTPTHYVRADGNDTTGDGSLQKPWQTIQKAITVLNGATAPTNPVIQIGPGYYKNSTATISKPMTFKAQFPAVNDQGQVINSGNQSVIEPIAASIPNSNTWVEVTITAPGFTGAPAGAQYKIWKWANSGVSNASQLGFSSTRDGLPQRVAHWDRKGSDLTTVEGWVEKLYTNKKYNYGFTPFGADIYLRLPDDINPNSVYVAAGAASGLILNGPNIRISGLHIKQMGRGIELQQLSTFGVVDHNLITGALYGIHMVGGESTPSIYGSDHLIEHNLIRDTGHWVPTLPPPTSYIPWEFIKSCIQNADGTLYGDNPATTPANECYQRLGAISESTAVNGRGGAKRIVVRNNVMDGYFNGYGGWHVGFDRYATQDNDVYGNTITRIGDDAFEADYASINHRYWNNKISDSYVFLSTGPASYGPIHAFRNQIINHGTQTGARGNPEGTGFKYSGNSIPVAKVIFVNNTFWTNKAAVDASGQYGGGGPNTESFYFRNNIIRATRYAFQTPIVAKWNEDYNHFATTDATKGVKLGGGLLYSANVAGYRTATSNAAHTNVTGDFITTSAVDNALNNPSAGDLSLKSGSAFVDAGTVVPNITECFSGSAPDLGAIESGNSNCPTPSAPPSSTPQPSASATTRPSPTPSSPPTKLGDVNRDTKVDIFDYNLLLTDFGKTQSGLRADINNSGKVDIFDYNLLLTNFGK